MDTAFRTTFTPSFNGFALDHASPICLMGSCFSEHIGRHLQGHKFKVNNNAFGVIFHPIPILRLIAKGLQGIPLAEEEFLQLPEGAWVHYQSHSRLQHVNKQKLQEMLHNQLQYFKQQQDKPLTLILTFGTAYGYTLKSKGSVVANCHRQPQQLFDKQLSKPENLVEVFNKMHSLLPKSWQVILTVSPVRHLKDTLPGNQLSKSVLRYACHLLEQGHKNVHYFPSYEILNDDLRDYRFYTEDMLHPGKAAVDYIWESFVKATVAPKSQAFIKEWAKLQPALSHRPRSPHSPKHLSFLESIREKLHAFKGVDLAEEISDVEQQMANWHRNAVE